VTPWFRAAPCTRWRAALKIDPSDFLHASCARSTGATTCATRALVVGALLLVALALALIARAWAGGGPGVNGPVLRGFQRLRVPRSTRHGGDVPQERILYVVSTERGSRVRILSARRAGTHERRIYEEDS
jgi:hypothetical protein